MGRRGNRHIDGEVSSPVPPAFSPVPSDKLNGSYRREGALVIRASMRRFYVYCLLLVCPMVEAERSNPEIEGWFDGD